jgi:RNA polymerase sigma factor (sigma-70 family)
MASGPYGAVLQQIHRLFQAGSVGGLSEWQLLHRYVTARDESAFEALVARHGPMVLAVCGRLLDDPHAVEDAFQATFLVLVRKARSLGEHDAIGHWLYGVAYRVALRQRSETVRRRSFEKQVETIEQAGSGQDPSRLEIAGILDDELNRLPASYRAPVVLCLLEGLTHEEAARQLRWPVGTVKGRLARAREMLQGRLSRRGLAPTASVLLASFVSNTSAAVPESLIRATVRAALQISTGQAASCVVSTSAVRLMEGVLSTMFATNLKLAAAVLGTCGGLVLGGWALAQQGKTDRPGQSGHRVEAQKSLDARVSKDSGSSGADQDSALVAALEKPAALKFQETPLGDVLKVIREQTRTDQRNGIAIYVDPQGLKEAGATMETPVSIETRDAPLKSSLDSVLRPLKLGATTRDGLLVISSRQEIALIEVRKLNEALQQTARPPTGLSARGGLNGESAASWLKRVGGQRTYTPLDAERGGPSAFDDKKQAAIIEKLNQPLSMPFANETTLQDVIKYIKSATISPVLPEGIPVYIDPVGLQEEEKTMESTITLSLEGVPLQVSLRLVLKQLGLTYFVKDGLMTITGLSSSDSRTPILELAERAERGDLSLSEMKALIELFKTRAEVERYVSGEGFAGPQAQAKATADPKSSTDDEAKTTKAIAVALDKAVTLQFDSAQVRDAIKAVQKMTVSPELPGGIPVYVHPIGSIGAAGADGAVTINLTGVKLKTGLRLLLSQIDLAYAVQDGVVIIAPPGSPLLKAGD